MKYIFTLVFLIIFSTSWLKAEQAALVWKMDNKTKLNLLPAKDSVSTLLETSHYQSETLTPLQDLDDFKEAVLVVLKRDLGEPGAHQFNLILGADQFDNHLKLLEKLIPIIKTYQQEGKKFNLNLIGDMEHATRWIDAFNSYLGNNTKDFNINLILSSNAPNQLNGHLLKQIERAEKHLKNMGIFEKQFCADCTHFQKVMKLIGNFSYADFANPQGWSNTHDLMNLTLDEIDIVLKSSDPQDVLRILSRMKEVFKEDPDSLKKLVSVLDEIEKSSTDPLFAKKIRLQKTLIDKNSTAALTKFISDPDLPALIYIDSYLDEQQEYSNKIELPRNSRRTTVQKEIKKINDLLAKRLRRNPKLYDNMDISKSTIRLILEGIEGRVPKDLLEKNEGPVKINLFNPFIDRMVQKKYPITKVITFLKTLADLGKTEELELSLQQIFKMDNAKLERVRELISPDDHAPKITTTQLNEKIKSLGIDQTQAEKIFINNFLDTSDGLSLSNLEKNLNLIAWDLENNNPPLIKTELFNKYFEPFSKHKSFAKLQGKMQKLMKDFPIVFDNINALDPRVTIAFHGMHPEVYKDLVLSNVAAYDHRTLYQPDLLHKYLKKFIEHASYADVQKMILEKLKIDDNENWSKLSKDLPVSKMSLFDFVFARDLPENLVPSPEVLKYLSKYLSADKINNHNESVYRKICVVLQKMTTDDRPDYRLSALSSLLNIDTNDQDTVSAVIKALKDPNAGVSNLAIENLSYCECSSPINQNALVDLIKDPDVTIQSLASDVLAKAKPQDRDVLLNLAELLNDENPQIRLVAEKTLDRIQPTLPEVLRKMDFFGGQKVTPMHGCLKVLSRTGGEVQK